MKIYFRRKPHRGAFFGGTGTPYDAARHSPVRADVPGGFPADAFAELTESAHLELVRKVRYLAKNDGVARELINCYLIYAVGDGLKPQPLTANDSWNLQAEEYFSTWAKHPDVSGRHNFTKLQKFVCRAYDVDGESFIVKTEIAGVPKIQLLETHRVPLRTDKDWTAGIKIDDFGRPLAYRVDQGAGKFASVPADAMIHAFIAQSPSDLRGVPWIQHSANHLLDATEFIALEKRAGKLGLDLAVVYKVTNPEKFDEEPSLGSKKTDADDVQRTSRASVAEVTGGKALILGENEDVKTLTPTRPSDAVVNFTKAMHQLSSAGTLPYEFAVDNSDIGGAGIRLIVAKAARYFSERQTELIDGFLNPVWKFVIGHAVKTGKLPAQDGWDCVDWVTPRSLTVDAGRDAAQERENVKSGLKTLTDYLAESGEDVKKYFRRRANEIALRNAEAERAGIPPEQIFSVN